MRSNIKERSGLALSFWRLTEDSVEECLFTESDCSENTSTIKQLGNMAKDECYDVNVK